MSTFKDIITNIRAVPNLWSGVVPAHILGWWTLFQIAAGSAPSRWWIATLIGYFCIMVLGVSLGLHRYSSHGGFTVNKYVKILLLWFGTLSGQGSAIVWSTIHRGYHHKFPDKEGDPHSPKDGFWHSYIFWMFKLKQNSLSPKSVLNLIRDPVQVFFHKHYVKILLISHLTVALISFDIWLYGMAFPAFLSLHAFALVTSVTHYPAFGYKTCPTNDSSINSVWIFPVILGEAWHNTHHADGRNPNYGGKRWWEIDPQYWIIGLLRTDK
jgi:stearoyl-CoA desaturase (delta-9 desaturase)